MLSFDELQSTDRAPPVCLPAEARGRSARMLMEATASFTISILDPERVPTPFGAYNEHERLELRVDSTTISEDIATGLGHATAGTGLEKKMSDLLMLALIAAGFAVATVYARFCDGLARPHTNAGEDER